MRLYHGSYMPVTEPMVNHSRKRLDFGQGFYLTSFRSQAEQWARVVSIRRGPTSVPTVNIFDLDDAAFGGNRIKRFYNYDMEWLEFVVDCPRGGDLANEYDLIEGGVADDKVIDTIEDYEQGRMTAEQALGQLKYKLVNHQICIRSQEIIDEHLHHVDTYTVTPHRP